MKIFPLLTAALLVTTTIQANELKNGDFVDGIKGWVIQRDGYPAITAREALTYCRFQDDGVILETAAIENKREKPASLILMQYLNTLQEGVQYTLSFEVKIPTGERVTYGLGIPLDSGPNRGNLDGGVQLTEITGEGRWEQISVSFVWNPVEALPMSTTEVASVQFRMGLTSEFGIRHVKLEGN